MCGYRVFAVDDGSTDDTAEHLRRMIEPARQRGVELVVWSKNNEGFTRSLKRCIEEKTTAPFIGLHGSGDVSYPARLSTLLELIQQNEHTVAAGCGVRVVTPKGETITTRTYEGIAVRDLPNGTIPRPATHECTLIRRSAYEAIGGYREFFYFAQDSDLWIRLSRLGTVVNTGTVLFDKVEIPQSISADWKKSLIQRKYSTLALQAGLAVDRGERDPIEEIVTSADPGETEPPSRRWQRCVDPRLLLSRFSFRRRIARAVFRFRFGAALGLARELVVTRVRAIIWSLRSLR